MQPLESRVLLAVTPPVLLYTFEEPDGATTVTNTGTGLAAYNGTLAGPVLPTLPTADPSPGGGKHVYFNGSGTVNGNGGRIDVATLLNPVMGGSATLAFYMRSSSAGVANAWESPGVTGAEVGNNNDIFWGNLTPAGGVRVQAGDGAAAATPLVSDGTWHRIVLTRDAVTGAERAFVDGRLVASVIGETGQKGANFRAIGATTNVALDLTTIQGYTYLPDFALDNLEVYNYAMTTADVLATYGPPNPTLPAAPTAFTATAVSDQTINLSFTDNANNEGAFEILQSRTNNINAATIIATLGPSTDTGGTVNLTAGNLFPGTQYFYFVRAISGAGASAPVAANATTQDPPTRPVTPGAGAWAEFFNVSNNLPNIDATPALSRVDPQINFNYGDASPGAGVNNDNHSGRWTGMLGVPTDFNGNGTPGDTVAVRFVSATDDGAFMWINGETVIFDQTYHGIVNRLADRTVNLVEGQAYPYQFQFFEGGGGSGAFLRVVNPPTGAIVDVPAEAFVSTQRGPVPAPSNLRATNLDFNQGTIVFDNENSTAQNYFVTVTGPAGDTRQFRTTPDASPFTIGGLAPNTTYNVRVRGYNIEGGLSPESATSFTTLATGIAPASPTILRVFPRAGATAVHFTDQAFNETGYLIEKSVNGGGFAEAGRVAATAPGTSGGILSFFDNSTAAGQSLVYRITALGTAAPAGAGDSPAVTSTAGIVPVPGTGVRKRSYDDIDFTGSATVPDPVEQTVPRIDENFVAAGPAPGIGADQFSVIYDGVFRAEVTGSYRFGLSSDDGVSLKLTDTTTGTEVINFDNLAARRGADYGGPQDIVGPVNLVAGRNYNVEVRLTEDGGDAGVRLWQSVEGLPFETVPGALLSPTAATGSGITEVYIKGTDWQVTDGDADPNTRSFTEYLEFKGLGDNVMGYRLLGTGRTPPAGNPEDIIPWINANQIVVRYAAPPTGGVPTPAAFTLTGLSAASTYTITNVAQVPGDNTAFVLTLNKPLGGGNPATGVAPTDAENGDYVTLGAPGAGASGGNFSFRFNVLQGDTDHLNETSATHAVLARDFAEVKKKFFKDTNSPVEGTDADYTPFHDVDGSGSILARDFAEVKKRFFHDLPAPPPITGQGVQIFAENFNNLPLRPFVSASESGGTGADWSDQLPTGWVRDNTTTPTDGPDEFFGFSFLDKTAWIATEGDQERSFFTRGTGTVMVADPDAYDDEGDIDPDLFRVLMTTRAIPLTNVAPGTATLKFDSSFRPYDGMTGSVEVSFDGGTNFTNILSLTRDNSGGDSSLTRVDEAVSIALNNPAGAASMLIRFGMTNAGNDWWWAVDNVVVTADVVAGPAPAASEPVALAPTTAAASTARGAGITSSMFAARRIFSTRTILG